ncbi:MAG TPA: hypothetical protein VFP54_12570 [Acidimicrobiales bacterium]|nr:hypothetical protein [Acidimicrobiales bacterium]
MSTTRRLVAFLAALIGLLLLVVGVPLALAALAGWPLPHALPDPSAVTGALRNGWAPDGPFVLKALAVVCWVAWADLATCLLVEITAALRGRHAAPRIPLSGWAQPFAAKLVAALLLAGSSLGTLDAAAAPAPPLVVVAAPAPPLVVVAAPATSSAPPPTTAPAAADLSAPAPTPGPLYLVERHDTLWDLAAHHLGDPLRWRDLFDLNHDRVQPDGRHLTDPHWIYPGWTLEFPADATGLQTAATPTQAPTAAPPRPNPQPTTAPAPAPTTSAAPTTLPATPPTVAEPAAPAPAEHLPATPAATPTPTIAPGTSTSGANGHPPAPPHLPDVAVHHSRGQRFPLPDIGLPLLAAGGLIAAVDQARRHRQRHRPPGHLPARPPVTAEPLERRARAVAADHAAEWIDAALRYHAAKLAGTPTPPAIIGARAGTLGVELLLDQPSERPPDGFEAHDDGHVWRLDDTVDLEAMRAATDGISAPCPALITLGATADGPVLLNVEHARTLAVGGAPDRCAAFLAGAALELATAPWADGTRIVLTGSTAASLDGLDPVERVHDPVSLADDLQRSAAANVEALGSRATALAARVEAPWSDAWQPAVIVADGSDANPEVLDRIARIAGDERSGVVLITSAPIRDAAWRLTIDATGAAVLAPLGLIVHCGVDASAIEDAAALLMTATAEPERAAEDVIGVVDSDDPAPLQADPPTQVDPLPEAAVRVGVLGPVEVQGWAKPPGRRKLTELVTYLATHDRPVPTETLRCALWPLDDDGGEVAYATFKQAISRARAALGEDDTGAKHLPEAEGGTYRVGASVRSDWGDFRLLTEAASSVPSGEAIELLRQALDLVRGAPFTDAPPGSYSWAWSEQLVSDIEVAVTDTAEKLALLALDAGDET